MSKHEEIKKLMEEAVAEFQAKITHLARELAIETIRENLTPPEPTAVQFRRRRKGGPK